MIAYQIRCAASIACLLVASPTLADNNDKKQQARQRPAPQQMRQQQAQPTLPDNGTRINTPGGAPAGSGAAGSVNAGKPMAPVGAQAIGGQQTGGAATAGATVSTTTTSSQPKSGNTLVNPNAPGNQAGGAMPGDFSRDKKLQNAVDGGASAVTNQATTTSGPGQKSGTALIDGTQSNFESMRGDQGSRTSQQGMFPAAGPSTATVPPAGGAPIAIPYPVTTTAPATTPRETPPAKTTTSGDDAGTLKGMASSTNMGEAKYKMGNSGVKVEGAAITRMTTSGTQPAGTTTPSQTTILTTGTPSPDGGAGTPVPASVQNLGGKGPSLEQTKKERGRQTGVPNDDKQQVDRMRADQRAAGATMAGRRTNAINPGDQTTPAGGFSGSPKSGVKQTENKGGGRPGCPPDNPAC
ncbi:MAG: DUF4150 domain-containing protein [Betaproteobacteria bacterium]|nr:DUF4150 domain-containing protein [Betaproteobacteria bacterium]